MVRLFTFFFWALVSAVPPRLCALAELAWTPREGRDWTDFEERLIRSHTQRLACMGIAYRLPPPEAVYEGDSIRARAAYPWWTLRYTTDGTDPVETSPLYTGPLATSTPEHYRFAVFDGQGLRSLVREVDLPHHAGPFGGGHVCMLWF